MSSMYIEGRGMLKCRWLRHRSEDRFEIRREATTRVVVDDFVGKFHY